MFIGKEGNECAPPSITNTPTTTHVTEQNRNDKCVLVVIVSERDTLRIGLGCTLKKVDQIAQVVEENPTLITMKLETLYLMPSAELKEGLRHELVQMKNKLSSLVCHCYLQVVVAPLL